MTPIIYPSAAFSRRSEIRAYAKKLTGAGFTVRARWITEATDTLIQAALNDAEDLKASDMIIRFSDPEYFTDSETVPRRLLSAARMWEMGAAAAWGKTLCAVGGHQGCFDDLPQVIHFSTFDDCLRWLNVFKNAA